MPRTSDTRITGYEPLLAPAALLDELPLSEAAAAIVERTRAEVRAVLDGSGDRLLVIAGPCSVHDPVAALDYAGRLTALREQSQADLLIVMRVYFEKPRTVTGWKAMTCTAACATRGGCCSTSWPSACRSAANGWTRSRRSTSRTP
jgi:3-deoxy-7-phosphoheptulonate synthase